MSYIKKLFGYEIDLSREGHTACPWCRKEGGGDRNGDNMMVYGLDSNGKHKGSHCFKNDKHHIPDQVWMEENGEDFEEEEILGSEFNPEIHQKLKETTGLNSYGYRGIREDISKFFGVRYKYEEADGKTVKGVLYPTTQGYEISGYKQRTHPKNFKSPGPIGETGKDCDLFGQFRFKTFSNTLLIVGGEHDQLAAYQILVDAQKNKNYDPIAVVSGTTGESSVYKQLQSNYDFINQFKKVVVAMDNDEAGREATERIYEVLPKGKVFVMNMRYKDPNEYIFNKETGRLTHKEQEFVNDFWSAKPYTPSGVVGSSGLLDKIIEAEQVEKVPLPPFMRSVQELMAGGIPLKRIVTLVAASGAGKSTIIDECVYFWLFNSPHRVGVLSLESDSAEYGKKLLSRHIHQKIDLIESVKDKIDLLSSELVLNKSKELFENSDGIDRFDVVDERDGSIDEIKELILKLIIQRECKLIIVDPLSDILDGLSPEEQRVVMKWMKGVTKTYGVTLVLVAHVRKNGSGNKANSTGADLHEEDISGSGSIFQSSHCNIIFTRNKEAEDPIERNTTHMKVTKLRWTGQTSPYAGKFYYDNKTHTVYDFDTYFSGKVE